MDELVKWIFISSTACSVLLIFIGSCRKYASRIERIEAQKYGRLFKESFPLLHYIGIFNIVILCFTLIKLMNNFNIDKLIDDNSPSINIIYFLMPFILFSIVLTLYSIFRYENKSSQELIAKNPLVLFPIVGIILSSSSSFSLIIIYFLSRVLHLF